MENINTAAFIYDDIAYVSGGTNFGNAFKALNEKLSRKAFLNASAGSYTPLIILLTDGKPSDIALYPEELDKLRHNSWFQYATKAGIAIEEGALSPECKQVLLEFTGNAKNVLEAKDTNVLSKQIELVTLTGVDFVTQQGSLQNANNGAQPAAGNRFGSTVVPPQPVQQSGSMNSNQGMMGTGAPTPTPTPTPTPAPAPTPAPTPVPQPTVNVTDGADPVIPGLADIDWDNDFPTFN